MKYLFIVFLLSAFLLGCSNQENNSFEDMNIQATIDAGIRIALENLEPTSTVVPKLTPTTQAKPQQTPKTQSNNLSKSIIPTLSAGVPYPTPLSNPGMGGMPGNTKSYAPGTAIAGPPSLTQSAPTQPAPSIPATSPQKGPEPVYVPPPHEPPPLSSQFFPPPPPPEDSQPVDSQPPIESTLSRGVSGYEYYPLESFPKYVQNTENSEFKNKIVYSFEDNSSNKRGLRIIKSDNTILEKILYQPGNLKWSPDGNKILYIERNKLFTIDKEFKEEPKLIDIDYSGISYFQNPVWSPDGNKIYIESYNGPLYEIKLSEIWVGYKPKKILEGFKLTLPKNSSYLLFTPTYIGGSETNTNSIYKSDLDGTNQEIFFNNSKMPFLYWSSSFSPDGKEIIMNGDLKDVDNSREDRFYTFNKKNLYPNCSNPDKPDEVELNNEYIFFIDSDGKNLRYTQMNEKFSQIGISKFSSDSEKVIFFAREWQEGFDEKFCRYFEVPMKFYSMNKDGTDLREISSNTDSVQHFDVIKDI
tara:strand:- start:2959 stop:4536 length:1578 start_codon:yes stop_codon:yes gene_type:complete